jgi:anthranilate synthase/aminodeoxychorismate synthase-like glutamine amidotransferase
MFKKILVIDNFDSFTFNLVDYLEQLGCEVHVYRNDVDPSIVEEVNPDLIVLSPGPSVPKNAGNLMDIIDRYHDKYPMFGVCLGHEAFIEYFGGSLKFTKPVHGKSSEMQHDGQSIFSDLDPNFLAGRYHSLVADEVPDCFEISAKCEGEFSPLSPPRLVMGIRHKTLPIEGVQFHPESVLSMKGKNGFNLMKNVIHKKFTNV